MESKLQEKVMEEINKEKKECWNGKKSAGQLSVDSQATELFLG